MSRKPWFRKSSNKGWWLPATPETWAILGLFVILVVATAFVPAIYRPIALIALGLAYLQLSYLFSRAR